MQYYKRIITIFILLTIFSISSIYAFEWNEEDVTAIDENEEILVVSTTNIEKEIHTVLQDADENVFTIIHTEPITEKSARIILKYKNLFFQWSDLKIKDIRFVEEKDILKISILPVRYICNGVNIISNLPAGMMFTYTEKESLQYNFRIVKDKIFIRIKGFFIDKLKFANMITEALADPTAFLKKRDPEYFVSKLDKLQNDMDKLSKENSILQWAVITLFSDETITDDLLAKVITMKKENPALNADKLRNKLKKDKGVNTSEKIVNAILTVYFKEWVD